MTATWSHVSCKLLPSPIRTIYRTHTNVCTYVSTYVHIYSIYWCIRMPWQLLPDQSIVSLPRITRSSSSASIATAALPELSWHWQELRQQRLSILRIQTLQCQQHRSLAARSWASRLGTGTKVAQPRTHQQTKSNLIEEITWCKSSLSKEIKELSTFKSFHSSPL